MSTPTVLYVIAAYLGPRGFMDQAYVNDPWCYLKYHMYTLGKFRHHVGRVLISLNTDAPLPSAPSWLPKTIGGAPVEFVQRPNIGCSYGGFADAFAHHRDAFSHYILMEDDYVFVRDNFDDIMLTEMQREPSCGMVAGAVYSAGNDPRPHAAVMAAMASSQALAAGAATCEDGRLPAGKAPDYAWACYGQKAMSYCVHDAGFALRDWLATWSTAYRSGHGTERVVRWFNRTANPQCLDARGMVADLSVPALVVPVQVLRLRSRITDGSDWYSGVVNEDGTISDILKG